MRDEAFDWSHDKRPNVPWGETIIYEAHVRGVSMLRPDLCQHERGTFAALASPEFIERRGEPVSLGQARLLAAVRADGSLDQMLDSVLAELIPSGPSDDVALLGMRWLG